MKTADNLEKHLRNTLNIYNIFEHFVALCALFIWDLHRLTLIQTRPV